MLRAVYVHYQVLVKCTLSCAQYVCTPVFNPMIHTLHRLHSVAVMLRGQSKCSVQVLVKCTLSCAQYVCTLGFNVHKLYTPVINDVAHCTGSCEVSLLYIPFNVIHAIHIEHTRLQ